MISGPVVLTIGVRDLIDSDDYELLVVIPDPPPECQGFDLMQLEVCKRWPDLKFRTHRHDVASWIRSGAIVVVELHRHPTVPQMAKAEPALAFPSAPEQPDLFE